MKRYYNKASAITRWYLVRHAPVTSEGDRIYGSNNVPADFSDSERFCQFLAKKLPKNAILLTSTLDRAIHTAQEIEKHGASFREHHRVAPFNEQDFGDWQGRTYQEAEAMDESIYQRFWLTPAYIAPPNGESFAQVVGRVGHEFLSCNKKFMGENIVMVSHGGPMKAIMALCLDLPLEASFRLSTLNYSLTMIDVIHYDNDQVYRLRGMNILPDYE